MDVKINSGGVDGATNNTTFVFGTMADMLKQIKASTDVEKAEEIIENYYNLAQLVKRGE